MQTASYFDRAIAQHAVDQSHQDERDCAIERLEQDLWAKVTAKPNDYTECGFLSELTLDEDLRALLVKAVCAMVAKDPLAQWHATVALTALRGVVAKEITAQAIRDEIEEADSAAESRAERVEA